MPILQSRDKTYLYTLNPSPIHHRSNKLDHHLKIVDYFISVGMPESCLIEPIFGCYEPDLYYEYNGKQIAVEIQITPISGKKMQEKVNQFVAEYEVSHQAKTLVICSNNTYKNLKKPSGFNIFLQPIPIEKCFKI